MLLKAMDARIKTDEINNENAIAILNNIEQKINEAIEDGRYKIECCGDLPYKVEKQLSELGYKIKTYAQYNDHYFRITW